MYYWYTLTQSPKSFSSALHLEAKRFFEKRGESVQVSDLYEMDFNPVASPSDFSDRANPDYFNYALEQRRSLSADTISDDITTEIEKVEAADFLIINFPLYWFSMPSMFHTSALKPERTFWTNGAVNWPI